MPFVEVKGGTYCVGDRYFPEGITECDDPAVLEAVDNERLPWVKVRVTAPAEHKQLELPEPPQPALETQGQKVIAETRDGDEGEKTAVAKMDELANRPEEKAAREGEPCPFCDRVLKNFGAQVSHVKSAHPEDYDAWRERLRASKASG